MYRTKPSKQEKAAQILEQAEAERAAREKIVMAEQRKRAELSRRYSAIFSRLKKKLSQREKQPLAAEVQLSLGKAIGLLTSIPTKDGCSLRNHPYLIDALEACVASLLSEPPNVELAERILEDIDRVLHPRIGTGLFASFKRSMGLAPSAVVACGLGLVFLGLGFLLALSHYLGLPIHDPSHLTDINDSSNHSLYPDALLFIGMAGALGSIASIMIRIQDFSYARSRDPWPFLLLGLFKPMVGAAFAVFTFAAITAAFLPLKVPDNAADTGYFFLALAFVAGFSERFAGDLITSTEHYVLDTEQEPSTASPHRSDGGEHHPNGKRKVDHQWES